MNKWINDIDENNKNNIKVKRYCKQCHKPMIYIDENNNIHREIIHYKNGEDICKYCYNKQYLVFLNEYYVLGKEFDLQSIQKIRIKISHVMRGYSSIHGYNIVVYFSNSNSNKKNWHIAFLFKFEELTKPTYKQLIKYKEKYKYDILNDDFMKFLYKCSEETFNQNDLKLYIGL